MNASCVPSGEYSGRDSSAGCETRRCASPPLAGATQMSPPETKAISGRVGQSAGSVRYGTPAASAAVESESHNMKLRMYQILTVFLVGCLNMRLSFFLIPLLVALAQDTQPPTPELNAAEKLFQE